MIDLTENLLDLAERYPQWAEELRVLRIRESYAVRPADNDGQAVYIHPRLMQYYTREGRSFYLAQQFLHLKLGHFARGEGKRQRLWKRASDAVVNALLKEDGFAVPEDAFFLPGAAESSAEKQYAVLLKSQKEDEEKAEDTETVEVPAPDEKNHQIGIAHV